MDLLLTMLVYEPDKRVRPTDALEHPFFQDGGASTSTSSSTTGVAEDEDDVNNSQPDDVNP